MVTSPEATIHIHLTFRASVMADLDEENLKKKKGENVLYKLHHIDKSKTWGQTG